MAGYTLFLNDKWDITLDPSGKIATTSGLYGIAQGVANAIRLFTGDAYFGQTDGIPHFDVDLGRPQSMSVVRTRYRQAALTVPGVRDAVVILDEIENRTLTGVITVTTTTGETIDVNF